MIRLVFRTIKNRKMFSLLFILAISIILLMTPITLHSLQNTITQVEADITQYGRGSYDILVRPKGTRNNVEKEFGVVEENYLGAGDGGISRKEWKDINSINDVEVAAPVASLGYFTGISKTLSLWMPDESTKTTVQFYTAAGVNKYPIGKEKIGFLLEIEEDRPESDRFDRVTDLDPEVFNYFSQYDPAQFMLPPTYHLLVGIDPDSEKQLTDISFDKLNEPLSPRTQEILNFAGDAPIITVMKLIDPQVPVQANVKVDSLPIKPEQTEQFRKEMKLNDDEIFMEKFDTKAYKQLLERLKEYPSVDSQQLMVDFSGNLNPFESEALMVNKSGEVTVNEDYGVHWSQSGTSKYFSSSAIPYEMDESKNELSVKQLGKVNGIPTYRNSEELGGTVQELETDDLPFVLQPVGEYEVGERQNQLAASPLGIYQLAPITLIADEQGNAVKETEVLPTILPGSFVPAPAHGVVTLEGAEIIKGDRPIDAIRVRVAGITDYTEEAAAKIERVAGEIAKQGYEVDVVAGASHQDMKVNVEGLGTVLEPWTTLGAAASIVEGWNGTALLLTLAFTIVALIYLLSRLTFWRVSKQADVQLLYQLGWGKRHIRRLLRGELALLSVLSWVLSFVCLFAIQMRWQFSGWIYVLHLAVFACVVLFLFLAVEWKWRQLMVKPQNGQSADSIPAQPQKKLVTPVGKSTRLVRTNIRYFRRYIRSPFIQLGLVSALSTFVYLSLYETVQHTNLTLLGQHVNFQVSGLHMLIVTSAYAIALFTVIETMTSLLTIRQREVGILRAIGWQHRHILRVFLSEVAVWAGVAVVLGNGIGLLLYGVFYPFTLWAVGITALSLIGFYGLILLVAASVIQRFVKQELAGTFVLRRQGKVVNKEARETV